MGEADIEAVSAVRVRGWQAAYRGLMPQTYLDGMSVAADAERRRSWFGRRSPEVVDLVAESAGEVVGWASVGPARDPDVAPGAEELPDPRPTAGELFALYVAPERIGTGVGRALLAAGTDRARQSGYRALYLWVVRGNARAGGSTSAPASWRTGRRRRTRWAAAASPSCATGARFPRVRRTVRRVLRTPRRVLGTPRRTSRDLQLTASARRALLSGCRALRSGARTPVAAPLVPRKLVDPQPGQ